MGLLEWYATGLWIILMTLCVRAWVRAKNRRAVWGELNSSQISKAFRRRF